MAIGRARVAWRRLGSSSSPRTNEEEQWPRTLAKRSEVRSARSREKPRRACRATTATAPPWARSTGRCRECAASRPAPRLRSRLVLRTRGPARSRFLALATRSWWRSGSTANPRAPFAGSAIWVRVAQQGFREERRLGWPKRKPKATHARASEPRLALGRKRMAATNKKSSSRRKSSSPSKTSGSIGDSGGC